MEIEITKDLAISSKEKKLLDMHSFINALSVLMAQLQFIALDLDDFEILDSSFRLCNDLKNFIYNKEPKLLNITLINDIEKSLSENIEKISEIYPETKINIDFMKSTDNAKSVVNNLKKTLNSLLVRINSLNSFESYKIEKLKEDLYCFFNAVEKNSKGAFKIKFDPSQKDNDDYLINLDIKSIDGEYINIPLIFPEVMRDLMANSRKYTPPGGFINTYLEDDGEFITFCVKDNGRGIPEDQISKVVDFGFRAKNAVSKQTNGGGFGLTKAYYATKQFDGKMWIYSELDKGTKVTIKIPVLK